MSKQRVTASLTKDTSLFLDGAIEAGVYVNLGDGIRSAIRQYFATHPEIATESVVELYKQGEIDLITASRIADHSPNELRSLLKQRNELRPKDA